MKTGLVAHLGVLLAAVCAGHAQPPTSLPRSTTKLESRNQAGKPAETIKAEPSSPVTSAFDSHLAADNCEPRVWASTEYLYWWVRNSPLPVPMVTTNADPATIAALNEAGTVTLLGGGAGDLDYHGFSGVRTTVGGWLDANATLGFEASGFLLEQRVAPFRADTSGPTGPVLGVPFNATEAFNFNPAGETTFNNGGAPTTLTVNSALRLWGGEANALLNLVRNDRYRLGLLAGFRYLDLRESLRLTSFSPDAATGGDLTVQDFFGTRNQFYGVQVGTRLEMTLGRASLETTAKVALGSMHEVLNVAGNTTVTGGAFGNPTGAFAGGIFGEPSNSDRSQEDQFAVVPEVQVRLGYSIGESLRGFVGYNFLFVSDVLRPGNQIDRNINPTQNGLFGGTGGVLTGPAQPLPQFNQSSFWAHGLNFGLELKF